MSDFSFPCPNCSQTITPTDDQIGSRIGCPACKQESVVPPPMSRAVPPPLPKLPPPLPAGAGVGSATAPLSAGRSGSGLSSVTELERQVLEGGRFVVFQYCFSILIMTFRRSSPVMFLRAGDDAGWHPLNYSLISLFAGWWGIPWGPIWTIATLASNLAGGKDITLAVLTDQFGPARASQILAQRRRLPPKGPGLKALRWGLAGVGLLVLLFLFAPIMLGILGEPRGTTRQLRSGEAQFRLANGQINANRGSVAFGNSPKAVAVAERFSKNMKQLREALFEGRGSKGLSVSRHEFLTCCELQETQCVVIVHVPELRRFTQTAKDQLGTLAWLTAQQALESENTGKPGMKLAVGLRGLALYDRVLIGTFGSATSGMTNTLSETVTGPNPEEKLFPLFLPAQGSEGQ